MLPFLPADPVCVTHRKQFRMGQEVSFSLLFIVSVAIITSLDGQWGKEDREGGSISTGSWRRRRGIGYMPFQRGSAGQEAEDEPEDDGQANNDPWPYLWPTTGH